MAVSGISNNQLLRNLVISIALEALCLLPKCPVSLENLCIMLNLYYTHYTRVEESACVWWVWVHVWLFGGFLALTFPENRVIMDSRLSGTRLLVNLEDVWKQTSAICSQMRWNFRSLHCPLTPASILYYLPFCCPTRQYNHDTDLTSSPNLNI